MHEELIELLRSIKVQDAAWMVAQSRAGVEVASAVSNVRDGSLLMQLSLEPEARRIYELPYVSAMSVRLLINDNEYLDSLLYEAAMSCIANRGNPSQQFYRNALISRDQKIHERNGQRATEATKYYSA